MDCSGEVHRYTGLHYRSASVDGAKGEATAGIRYASRLLSKPPAAFLATIVDLRGNEVARVLGASVALPRPVA